MATGRKRIVRHADRPIPANGTSELLIPEESQGIRERRIPFEICFQVIYQRQICYVRRSIHHIRRQWLRIQMHPNVIVHVVDKGCIRPIRPIRRINHTLYVYHIRLH